MHTKHVLPSHKNRKRVTAILLGAFLLVASSFACDVLDYVFPNPFAAATQMERDMRATAQQEELNDWATNEAGGITEEAPPPGEDVPTGVEAQIIESNPVGSGPMVVTVYAGDSSKFQDRPDLIVYANADYAAPPDGFQIRFAPESTSWYQWRNLENPSHWVEISNTREVTAIGVQFFADSTQGWARLILDGAEIWRGDTYGRWTDGYNWACYVEVSGVAPGAHTMRVENLGMAGGGGGQVVAVFFFGFRLP
jgi:hypothetical protein